MALGVGVRCSLRFIISFLSRKGERVSWKISSRYVARIINSSTSPGTCPAHSWGEKAGPAFAKATAGLATSAAQSPPTHGRGSQLGPPASPRRSPKGAGGRHLNIMPERSEFRLSFRELLQ